MREPFVIQGAKLNWEFANVQLALANELPQWLDGWAMLLRKWAWRRRELAMQTFVQWPVSLGGSVPDNKWTP